MAFAGRTTVTVIVAEAATTETIAMIDESSEEDHLNATAMTIGTVTAEMTERPVGHAETEKVTATAIETQKGRSEMVKEESERRRKRRRRSPWLHLLPARK